MGLGPSDRIQLIVDLMLPAKCSVCFKGSDGITKFADFGLQVERYGAVYFCANCCANFGQAVDMVPALDFEQVSVLLQEKIEEFDRIKEELADANSQLAVIRGFIHVPTGDEPINYALTETAEDALDTAESVESEGDGTSESNSDSGNSLEDSLPPAGIPDRINL